MVHDLLQERPDPSLADADHTLQRGKPGPPHDRGGPAPGPHAGLSSGCPDRDHRLSHRSAAAAGAFLSWTVLAPATQRTGAFKHILQNLLLVLRDCGTTRVGLVASLTHGGYVWAIHGFLPQSAAEWARLARVLQARLATVASHLTPTELGAIEKLLASPNPLALRAVAGSAIPVLGTTLGKHLLMGTEWKGELDFSDGPSVLIYLRRIGVVP